MENHRSQLLNFKETASYLNVKESHLRSLIFKRKIGFSRVGRLIRFEESKLMEWLKNKTQEVVE